MGSERPNSGMERPEMQSERPDLGSKGLHFEALEGGKKDGKWKPDKFVLCGIIGDRPPGPLPKK